MYNFINSFILYYF